MSNLYSYITYLEKFEKWESRKPHLQKLIDIHNTILRAMPDDVWRDHKQKDIVERHIYKFYRLLNKEDIEKLALELDTTLKVIGYDKKITKMKERMEAMEDDDAPVHLHDIAYSTGHMIIGRLIMAEDRKINQRKDINE